MDNNYIYRAYVKDRLHLNDVPKAFFKIRSAKIREDLLTDSNSSFKTLELPKNINNGDILVVYDYSGHVVYKGVIKDFGDDKRNKGDKIVESSIDTSQMQSFYSGDWIANPIYSYKNTENDLKWNFEEYYVDDLKFPKLNDVEELKEIQTLVKNDNEISTSMSIGNHIYAFATTNVYTEFDRTLNISLTTKGNANVYLNGILAGKTEKEIPTNIEFDFLAGWNKIDICFSLRNGNGGYYLNPKLSSEFEAMASSNEEYTIDNSWILKTYDPFLEIIPTTESFSGLTPSLTNSYLDSNISTSMNIDDYYYGKAYTHVYSDTAQIRSIKFTTNEAGSVYLNGKRLGETKALVSTAFRCSFNKGWNKIEVYYFNKNGNDGWNTTPKLNKIFSKISSVGTPILEDSIKETIDFFSKGYQKDSQYQDILIKKENESVILQTETSTEGSLETYDDQEVGDISDFIYDVYSKYGIVFDFTIPYGSWEIGDDINGAVCKIYIPNYSPIKVGDNSNYILDMSPTLEIEETNKLIIFSSDGIYRTTFIINKNNEILEEPKDISDRFEVVKTSIVYSDDDIETIKKSNLSSNMYNHKVTFKLLLDSKLYDYKSFKLGMPIDIWNGHDYYNSVLTGYELTINENEKPKEITLICGKVRTALTAKLNMKF